MWDLIETEIAPFDPPPPKTLTYRTKHEMDWITYCGDMAIRSLAYHDRCILNPHFGRMGGCRQSSIVLRKSDVGLSSPL